jgi:hypothetical protein
MHAYYGLGCLCVCEQKLLGSPFVVQRVDDGCPTLQIKIREVHFPDAQWRWLLPLLVACGWIIGDPWLISFLFPRVVWSAAAVAGAAAGAPKMELGPNDAIVLFCSQQLTAFRMAEVHAVADVVGLHTLEILTPPERQTSV